MLTGPVLSEIDPPFVTTIKNQTILIPIMFWKVVIFPKEDGKLYRVGFMMSERKRLIQNGIVEELEAATSEDELFMKFENAAVYQVNITLIEQLADIKLPKGIDSY